MHLKKLIGNINIKRFSGGQNVEIPHVNYDSRKIGPGDLFVAIKGHAQDGHDFIGDAVSRGAAAVLSEVTPEVAVQKLTRKPDQMPVFMQVSDSRKALSQLAVVFYQH
ncbi:MAG: UDP-N-acetylmuramoyl-L-alanyl-D-glutamate--2,6-diaminopimelate ligase, partial [Deltaproteobacteria bacterium]|nr:UDP-N-acetylmuramoyl-L-alanyl-D-glutamate--2,6-diaminopimelate ligase [Deltaproteobacteria bacterium]